MLALPWLSSAALGGLFRGGLTTVLILAAFEPLHAQSTYWFRGAVDGRLDTTNNWGTNSSGLTNGTLPAVTSDIVFNITANNNQIQRPSMGDADRAYNSIVLSNVRSTTIVRQGGTITNTSLLRGLILAAGITNASNAGTFQLGDTGFRVRLRIRDAAAAFNVANNSTNTIRFTEPTGLDFTNANNRTLAVSGVGSVFFDGGLGDVSTNGGKLALLVSGPGVAQIGGGSFSGGTTLAAGTIALAAGSALGTSGVTINGGAIGSVGSAQTISNSLTIGGNFSLGVTNAGFSGQATTFNGNVDLGGLVRTITMLQGSAIFGGVISNGGLTLNSADQSRTLTLTNTNNSFTETTTVTNSGRLVVSNATLVTTITATNISVNFAAAVPAGGTYDILSGPVATNSLAATSAFAAGGSLPANYGARIANTPNLKVVVSTNITPTITPSTNNISLTATNPFPGSSSSFTVSGLNLTNNITVTVSDTNQIAISTNNTDWTNTFTLGTNSLGEVSGRTIHVRLTGAPEGTNTNRVNFSSAPATNSVTVVGTVLRPATPTLSAQPSSLSGLQAQQGSVSAASVPFVLSGTAITNTVTVAAPTGLQVSFTPNSADFSNSLTIPPPTLGVFNGTNIYVRIDSNAPTGSFTRSVTNSTPGGTNNSVVQVSGQVIPIGQAFIEPANNTQLSGFTTELPNASTNQRIDVSGGNLLANIAMTPPPGWQIAVNSTNDSAFTNVAVFLTTNPAGVVSNTPVYVRIAPGATSPTIYTDSRLTLVSGLVSNNVLLSGVVTNPPPIVNLSTNVLNLDSTFQGRPSDAKSFTVSGNYLTTNILVEAPASFAVSLTNNANFTSSVTIPRIGESVAGTLVFVRMTGAQEGDYSDFLSVKSGTATRSLEVNGTVTPPPAVDLVMPASVQQGEPGVGTVSINYPSAQPVVVTLSSSAPNLISLPASITIPAGETSIEFPFETLNAGPTTTVTSIALTAAYGQDSATTVLLSDPSVAPFTVTGYAQTFSNFNEANTNLPVGWDVTAASAEASRSAWASDPTGPKFSVPGTNVFGFQHTAATGTAQQVLALRNDTGVPLSRLAVSYRGRVARTANGRSPVYAVSVAGTVLTNLSYSTESGASALRSATNTNVAIPPGGIFRVLWSSDRGTGSGDAKTIGLADVTVTSPVTPVPLLSVAPTNMPVFTTTSGTPSFPQVGFVGGTNLLTNITITPPPGFQIATNFAGDYSEDAITLLRTNGGVPSTPLYVQVGPAAAPGLLQTNLLVASTSGTNTVSARIALSALVFSNVTGPQILTFTNSLSGFVADSPANSAAQNFQFAAINLGTNPVAVGVTTNFAVSLDAENYSDTLSIDPAADGSVAPTTIYVVLRGTQIGANNGFVTLSAGGQQTLVSLSGVVNPPPPVITIDTSLMPTNVPQFSTPQGRPSTPPVRFDVGGSNLATNITVTAPPPYEISLLQNTNYRSSVVLSNIAGTVTDKPIFIRLKGTQLMALATNQVSLTSGALATNLAVTGQVTNAPTPDVSLSGTFTNFTAIQGMPSANQSFTASASNMVSRLTVVAPQFYQVSLLPGSGFGASVDISPANYTVARTTLYLRLSDGAPVGESVTGLITASTTDIDGFVVEGNSLAVGGTVVSNTAPFIVTDPKSLSGFGATPGGVSTNQLFNVGATNLTDFLYANAPAGYQISSIGASNTFSNSLRFLPVTPGATGQDRGLNYYDGTNLTSPGPANSRGSGFGNWVITTTTASGGSAGIFVGNPTSAGIVGMSPASFGLFANPANASNSVVARRDFANPMGTGEVFSFQWGNNFDAGSSGSKGMRLLEGTNPIFTINMGGSAAVTIRQGTNAPINMFTNYGTNPITVSFARTAANVIAVSVPFDRTGTNAGYSNNFTVSNVPTGFEFYARGLQSGVNADRSQPYFNNMVLTTNGGTTSANVASTGVFVRLVTASNSPVTTNLSGNVTLSSLGATNKFVALSGAIYGAPVLNVAPASLIGFVSVAGTASTNQTVFVTADALSSDVTFAAAGGYELSLSPDAGFATNLVIPNSLAGAGSGANVPLYVRLRSNAPVGPAIATITGSASGFAGQSVSNSFAVSGNVFSNNGVAQIGDAQPTSLTNFQATLGQASAPVSFTFNAVNLSNRPVVATVTNSNFQISLRPDGGWTNAVTNSPVGGTVSGAVNYVRLSATPNVPPNINSPTSVLSGVRLSAAGSGATERAVSLSGMVLPPPSLSNSVAAVQVPRAVQGFQSSSSSFVVTATNLQGPVTVTAAFPLFVSTGGTYASSVTLPTNGPNGSLSSSLNVVVGAGAQRTGTFTNTSALTFSTPGALNEPIATLPAIYTVVPRPAISADPNLLSGFSTVVGNPSDPPLTFNVSGTNLLEDIVVSAQDAGSFEISTNGVSGWTSSITVVPSYTNTTPGPPVAVAQDAATNYPGGNWPIGANGGQGFQPWAGTSSNGTGAAGRFIGNPAGAGIGGMSTNAFGLFANPTSSGSFANVQRGLSNALAVSDTLSFQWGINFDSGSGGNKGFSLFAGASELINVNNGGNEVITLNGTNVGFGYGTNVMTWSFTRSASNIITVTANDRDGSGIYSSNVVVGNGAINSVRFYASAMQAGDAAQPYFDNLLVTRPGPPVPTGGVVTNTPVYVRLRATAPVDPFVRQALALTSGQFAETKTVALEGQVRPQPFYTVTPAAVNNLSTVTNTPSMPGVFFVDAFNLVTNLVIRAPVGSPAAFEISTSPGTNFTSVISIPAGSGFLDNLPIYVRIASLPTPQFVSGQLSFSNRFATTEVTNVAVAGQVLQADPGDLRGNFNPPFAGSPVVSVAAATNSNFYIGGTFTNLIRVSGGVVTTNAVVRVARILASGAVDTSFDPGVGPNGEVRALLYSAADQGLYIGGQFTNVAGAPRGGLARLAVGKPGVTDGALDSSFDPKLADDAQAPVVNEIVRQDDGKILVGGAFATVGGTSSANITRLMASGSVDPGFLPPQPRGTVNAIALQPDGKILIGGSFAEVAGQPRRGLARLNRDGSLDTTFSLGAGASGGFNGTVFAVAVGSDGSVYVGGDFSSYNGRTIYNNLVKLSSTGELQNEFNFSSTVTGGFNGVVRSIIVRPTGALLVSGSFTQVANSVLFPVPVSVGRVTQILPNGTLDSSFNPGGSGANAPVLDAATLASGDLVVVGSFGTYDDVSRSGIAVLAGFNGLVPIITSPSFYTVNAGQPVAFSFTGTGAAPLSFSISATPTNSSAPALPQGVTFSPSGSFAGYPMNAGTYDMYVTMQPASGFASAPTPFTMYVVPTPVSYQSWAKAWFGNEWNNPAIAGSNVTAGNPSGLANFAIYALNGGNPYVLGPAINPSASPQTDTNNGLTYLTYTVNRNPLAEALYQVQLSTNLLAPWLTGTSNLTTMIDTPSLLQVRPVRPMSVQANQFLRLLITAPTNSSP